jgi:hypothetical protein
MTTKSALFSVGLAGLLALAACENDVPAWDPTLPPSSSIYEVRRGLSTVRGPIHIHSPYSHDACDGHGFANGQLDQTCLDDFRHGICTTHQDFVMLTDHANYFSQQSWDDTFLPAPGDEPVMVNGEHIASQLLCPDGSKVLLMVGSENDLMPIGLHSHVADNPDDRYKILQSTDAASADMMRAHGALIAVAHGESHDFDQLMAVQADATEIYNIHANVGPDIRAMMGLDPTAPILALFPFINMDDPKLQPDMAMLAFWEENPDELGRLTALWQAGRHVTATVGVDAHENVISGKLADGERGDAYRRMLRWFSNHLLVEDLSPDGLFDAIRHGRNYAAFELYGSPVGFDYRADLGGTTFEMGDSTSVGAQLTLVPPSADGVQPRDLRLRILRVDAAGTTEVAHGDGLAPVVVTADQPGVYRAEVRITPHHLAPYLGTSMANLAELEKVWIYTNPIYVE